MALIIEDGTEVADANSYISVTDARTWAGARGITLSADDTVVEVLLIKAMDMLNTYRTRFKGTKSTETQALQWPRYLVYIDEVLLADDVIPQELIDAQVQYAIEAQSNDLQSTGTGQETIREKVGPIETEFAPRGSSTLQAKFHKAEAFLAPLLKTNSSFPTLRV